MQAKHKHQKGCLLFVVEIYKNEKSKNNVEKEESEMLKIYPILQQHEDVFLAEVLGLPPHRELYFSIELILGETLTSKVPYMDEYSRVN